MPDPADQTLRMRMAPVLALTSRGLLLRTRAPMVLWTRLAVGGWLGWSLWLQESGLSHAMAPGQTLLRQIDHSATVVLTLVVLAVTAGAVGEERAQGTLGLLFMTGLSPRGVVIAKAGARILEVWLLLALTVPLALVSVALGGVSAADVLWTYAAQASWLGLVAACGLYASVLERRPERAYLFGLFVLFFLWFFCKFAWFASLLLAGFSPLYHDRAPWVTMIAYLATAGLLIVLAGRTFNAQNHDDDPDAAPPSSWSLAQVRNNSGLRYQPPAHPTHALRPLRPNSRPPPGPAAFVWLEIMHATPDRPALHMAHATLLAGCLLFLSSLFFPAGPDSTSLATAWAEVFACTGLATVLMGLANRLAHTHATDLHAGWDDLRLLPMDPGTIWCARLSGIIRFYRLPLLLAGATLVLGLSLGGWKVVITATILAAALCFWSFCAALSLLLQARGTTVLNIAMLGAVITTILGGVYWPGPAWTVLVGMVMIAAAFNAVIWWRLARMSH